MHPRILITGLLSLFLLICTVPQKTVAQDAKQTKKSSNKSKKAIADDPWADGKNKEEDSDTGSEDEKESEETPTDEKRITKALADQGSLSRSGRMEFDERLVKGQAAKSGAVYLFKRMPRRLPGLVPMRRSYRKRIVEPVLGEKELKPAVISGDGAVKPAAEEDTEKAEGTPDGEEKQPGEAEASQKGRETKKKGKKKKAKNR